MPRYKNRLERMQEPKDMYSSCGRAKGTKICTICRRDVPEADITFGRRHQLCPDCLKSQEERIAFHKLRIEREEALERKHGRNHPIQKG